VTMSKRAQTVALIIALLIVMAAPCYGCAELPPVEVAVECGGCK